MMKTIYLAIMVLIVSVATHGDPVLLDSVKTYDPGLNKVFFQSQQGGWWRDDSGTIQRTVESLRRSDGGVWDVENISAPHRIYAATDAAWWRVDPPSGTAAGFEIQFATVSLFRFIDAETWEEKTIDWARVPLITNYDQNVIDYPLFSSTNLYVISTPNGYKSNFYLANPSLIPSPTSAAYFGLGVDLETVYFAARYAVNQWPDRELLVDGELVGPGGIDAGYSAEFGTDLWMLPTKAYRNVTGFDGVDFIDAEDESYVYYVFDRLAQEILVLAPYNLINGADNVVIDPTTWTSGRTSSDDVAFLHEGDPTSNHPNDTTVPIGGNAGISSYHSLFRIASLPSAPSASSVSATLILKYVSSSGTPTLPSTNNIRRIIRPWVENQATWNVYSTGNNWNTAGAGGSGTDYNGAISKSIGAADIAISNNSTLNSWVTSWIDGSIVNNGFIIIGDDVSGYYNFGADDNATASNRPYLAITYTPVQSIPQWSDIDVQCVGAGGQLAVGLVLPATTEPVSLSHVLPDVTATVTTGYGYSFIAGQGDDADGNWDFSVATATAEGATTFILATSLSLTFPTQVTVLMDSSLTGDTDERYILIDWGGASGTGNTDVLDAIDDLSTDVLTNRAVVWNVTPGLNTRIENATTNIHARIGSATGDVRATWGMVGSVSTEVDAQHSLTRAAAGGWVANATGLINEASASLGLKLDSIAADVDVLVATGNFLNDNVKVSRAFYNTDTALTNGEFLRDVPANALSHVESRWLPVADVIAENWGAYVKREFTIYSYPDSAAGTTLASHLIPSSTAPTERTWTDKGATLW